MTQRIEPTDPLTLLTQLPSGWAQSCIVEPPRSEPACTLTVLEQVKRALRDDGTLWVILPHGLPLIDELRTAGWVLQRKPAWAWETVTGTRLFLLSKAGRYFYDASIRPTAQPPCEHRARRAWLIQRCLLAGTSPVACGACGAPYRRARRSEHPGRRYPTCRHHDPAGRCLVLDPYLRPGCPTGPLASGGGRSFLATPKQRDEEAR